jgi:excisionase family DNA binding protein
MPERLLYDVETATEVLNLGRTKIFELVRTGRLRSVKEGRCRLFTSAALRDYVALLEQEASL